MTPWFSTGAACLSLALALGTGVPAQQPAAAAPPSAPKPADAAVPTDYTIGPDDVLSVVFWRDAEMSAEVVVRPDGKISLPLLNDIQASGLTPADLKGVIEQQAKKFVESPSVSIVVKAIHSRKVFITGSVVHPGAYVLGGETTVLQLIAMAGGLTEYADSKNIIVARNQSGRPTTLKFNYKAFTSGKNLQANVVLKPGDTVVVP
jgi:polysaccharide export outer membrane protein